MNTRSIVLGALVFGLFVGCGGSDDHNSNNDAGMAGEGAGSGSFAGSGGRAGTGAGQAGKGGKGGTGGAAGGGDGGDSYSVGGQVSGLTGSGLKLQNNGGDDLEVSASGDFSFAQKLPSGSDYEVKVSTQPSDPAQTCSVEHASGKLDSANVTDVAVTCVIRAFKVGGNVTGLSGADLVLRNNGGDDLTVNSAGPFSFATSVNSGAAYAVTMGAQPSGFTCNISNGSGNVGSSDVTSVAVTCAPAITLQVAPGFGNASASWNNTAGATYDLYVTTKADCNFDQFDSCDGHNKLTGVTTPYSVESLTNGTAYYFKVKAAYSGGLTVTSNLTGARPTTPLFDGNVNVLGGDSNGTVYAGGSFQRLLSRTGSAVPLRRQTALPGDLPNFPIIDGESYAVAPDSSGGFFVGGQFNRVDEATHNYLVHIKSDGTLDSAWNPNPNNGVCSAGVLGQRTLYVSGSFTMIGGVSRNGLAAIDAAGAAISAWNPNPTSGPSVLGLANDSLIAGGNFTMIGGQPRANLAALDLATGNADASWNPAPNTLRSTRSPSPAARST